MLDRMIAARTALLLGNPFFGALALGLRLQEDPTCPTAWVDGRTLGFNPKFISGLTHAQATALVAHEVMHCAQGHPWRRDDRQFLPFNIACDKVINSTLKEAGFTLPPQAYYAEGPEEGQSAEWIYARFPVQEVGSSGQGDGEEGTGDPLGEVRDAPTAAKDGDGKDEDVPTEADWQQATKQAAMAAKAQGKLPGSLARFADQVTQPKVDWKSALRRFVQERGKSDYTWSKPNRRFIGMGLYLPELESHELGEIAIAVDTSGSIDNVALAAAKAEVTAVIDECKPSAVTVYYADAAIAQADRFERGDMLDWRPKGGGGTDFRPVFKACEDAEVQPLCIIYISDLQGTFGEPPDIPTVWVTDGPSLAPFGETLRMS